MKTQRWNKSRKREQHRRQAVLTALAPPPPPVNADWKARLLDMIGPSLIDRLINVSPR